MDERYLWFSNIGKSYPTPDGAAVIVKDFNLSVKKGEFVCIVGHSGCGKSTILSMAMGLNNPTEGGMILDDHEVAGPGTDRGVVFQSPTLLPWMKTLDNVSLSAGQVNRGKKMAVEKAKHYLANIGLSEMLDRYPLELSAGTRQKVGIARALALEPEVLLLDEPFSLLDALTRMELQDELMRLWDQDRKTVVMVTHDVDEALYLADRIVLMTSGPAATVGEILPVDFSRPRTRSEVINHPQYYKLRDYLISFLEDQAEKKPTAHWNATAPCRDVKEDENKEILPERIVMVAYLEML